MMKVLLLLLFSTNAFAGFMSNSLLFDCNNPKRASFQLKKVCDKKYSDCVEYPTREFHCETWSRKDGVLAEDPAKKATYVNPGKKRRDAVISARSRLKGIDVKTIQDPIIKDIVTIMRR